MERYPLNKGLQLFVNIVTSKEFLSFQTTLSSEIPSIKFYVSELSFQDNLNHLIWISVEEVMAKIQKLLKAKKLQCFGETWLERVDILWTSRHNVNSTSFCFSSSILHSSKSKVLLMHQLNLEIYIKHTNNIKDTWK